jgi:hypothetical protein
MLTHRLLQRALDAPTVVQSHPDCLVGKATRVSPVLQAHRGVANSDVSNDGSISRLHLGRRPTAVVRLIADVVVAAFQRAAERTWAHVGNEVLKREPSLTDRNALPSVVAETGNVWVPAAAQHRGPDRVFRRPSNFAARPMVGSQFLAEATTAIGVAFEKLRGSREMFIPARASAAPHNAAIVSKLCRLNGRESSKPCAAQVDWMRAHFASMWASMIRLTSSAMEIPSRFASLVKKARWRSVNEIICLITKVRDLLRGSQLLSAVVAKAQQCHRSGAHLLFDVIDLCHSVAGLDDAQMVIERLKGERDKSALGVIQALSKFCFRHASMIPLGITRGEVPACN